MKYIYFFKVSLYKLLLSSEPSDQRTIFCDAEWTSSSNTRRSITGYFVKSGHSPISWKSKKQATISRSSVEVEYHNLAPTIAEVVWIIGLFNELGITI